MLAGFFSTEPSTASSAWMLCGGRLRSRSSVRPAAARVSRSVSRRSTAIKVVSVWPSSGATDGADFDRDRRGHRSMQPRRHRVRADLADLVGDLEIASLEAYPELTLHGGGDVRGGHRAIQPALLTGLGLDDDGLRFEFRLERLRRALLVGGVPGRDRLQVGHLLQGSAGRG